jgi:hypothetical protein
MQFTKPIFLDSATFIEKKKLKFFCGEKHCGESEKRLRKQNTP